MIVGISMRLAPASYGEGRDALSHDWIWLLEKFGVTPVLIPNSLQAPADYARRFGVERLLLTGGDNVGAAATSECQTVRDRTEADLLAWALAQSVPVLGVCRGLQFINMTFGGGVTRDLAAAVPSERHVASDHPIVLEDDRRITVNSYHDQGVLRDQVAPGLQVFGTSLGGVVEALRLPGKPVAAIQWHPERPSPSEEYDRGILKRWLGGQ
jgi:N5-(cytidine 5'-diphosphoramidyl)-L-glutamine hydrolase